MCRDMGEGQSGDHVEHELRLAELALSRAKEAEGLAYDAWRDAVAFAHDCAENVNSVRESTAGRPSDG